MSTTDVTARTQALLDAEAERASEIERLVADRLTDELETRDLNNDRWSVAYLVLHIAHWQDLGADAIERGSDEYGGDDDAVDRENAELMVTARGRSWSEALDVWAAARVRSRSALSALDELTPAAETWFTEEGIDHMADHTVELRLWAELRRGTR